MTATRTSSDVVTIGQRRRPVGSAAPPARRDLVCDRLRRIPGVRWIVPQGAFYLFFDISTHFGRPTRLVLDETPGAASGAKTLADIDAEARAEHERATGQSVRNHPAILATLRILGGELEHIQVLERERTGAPGSDVIDEQP